jgi:hypothetical protein
MFGSAGTAVPLSIQLADMAFHVQRALEAVSKTGALSGHSKHSLSESSVSPSSKQPESHSLALSCPSASTVLPTQELNEGDLNTPRLNPSPGMFGLKSGRKLFPGQRRPTSFQQIYLHSLVNGCNLGMLMIIGGVMEEAL